jgi:hypothetical protein
MTLDPVARECGRERYSTPPQSRRAIPARAAHGHGGA